LVFPFELYCNQCGSCILRARIAHEQSEVALAFFDDDAKVDSWLSTKLREKQLTCPNCKREIHADPLVRAELLFAEWSGKDGQDVMIYYA
jgi:hypothetical protein